MTFCCTNMVLAPAAVSIFDHLERRRFDVAHLFWGHYPALVGHLVQRFATGVVSSVLLGAYDLDEDRYAVRVPGSVPVAQNAHMVWTHSRSNLARRRALRVPDAKVHCV